MATHVVEDPPDVEHVDGATSDAPAGKGSRRRRVLLIVAAVIVVLLALAAAWFVLGREQAEELSDDQALVDFRAGQGAAGAAEGRPVAGVYAATATGVESIGLPGFDEQLGPNAPVTVTYGDGGCFTARADLNSHHWRSWTYCPSATATFALVGLETFTERSAPGLDLATLSTYRCDVPLDVLWSGAVAGETRTGHCTGRAEVEDTVTDDVASIEVLGTEQLEIGGDTVETVHVRTVDEFSEAQTGTETGEWWLDAATGLPLRARIDAALSGGAGDYSETIELDLTSVRPAT